jgi:hypothetical protein
MVITPQGVYHFVQATQATQAISRLALLKFPMSAAASTQFWSIPGHTGTDMVKCSWSISKTFQKDGPSCRPSMPDHSEDANPYIPSTATPIVASPPPLDRRSCHHYLPARPPATCNAILYCPKCHASANTTDRIQIRTSPRQTKARQKSPKEIEIEARVQLLGVPHSQDRTQIQLRRRGLRATAGSHGSRPKARCRRSKECFSWHLPRRGSSIQMPGSKGVDGRGVGGRITG